MVVKLIEAMATMLSVQFAMQHLRSVKLEPEDFFFLFFFLQKEKESLLVQFCFLFTLEFRISSLMLSPEDYLPKCPPYQ